MKESLKAELPLEADDTPEAMSRVMAACLRMEISRRRFRSWFTPVFDDCVAAAERCELRLPLPVCAFFTTRLPLVPKILKSLILYNYIYFLILLLLFFFLLYIFLFGANNFLHIQLFFGLSPEVVFHISFHL